MPFKNSISEPLHRIFSIRCMKQERAFFAVFELAPQPTPSQVIQEANPLPAIHREERIRERKGRKPFSQSIASIAKRVLVEEQFNYIYLLSTCFTVAPVRRKICVWYEYVEKFTSYLYLKCANTSSDSSEIKNHSCSRLLCVNIIFLSVLYTVQCSFFTNLGPWSYTGDSMILPLT